MPVLVPVKVLAWALELVLEQALALVLVLELVPEPVQALVLELERHRRLSKRQPSSVI